MNPRKLAVVLTLAVVADGCSKSSSPTAPPSGPGSLVVVTVPGSATARLDGGTTVDYTRAIFDGLAAGSHTVALSMEGYADTSVTVSEPANGVIADTVLLRPLAGSPASIEELWEGYFDYAGPLAISTTGTSYVTVRTGGASVLVVISPTGVVQHQSVIPAANASPAFDIALDSSDNAYVAPSRLSNTIMRFNPTGSFVTSFGRRDDPYGSVGLAGIAVGPGDTIHVSAFYELAAVVEKYTPSGVFAYAFPTGSASTGPIEVGTDGSIYVAARLGSPHVAKFSRTGTPLLTWSVSEWPSAITRGPGGTLVVSSLLGGGVPSNTEKAPSRLERYAVDGTRLGHWGTETRGLPYLDRHGVDAAGNVVLPLRNDRRVLRYGTQ